MKLVKKIIGVLLIVLIPFGLGAIASFLWEDKINWSVALASGVIFWTIGAVITTLSTLIAWLMGEFDE